MLTMELAPTSGTRSVRNAVSEFAARHGVSPWPLSLIATELVANAIAVSPPDEHVRLRVRLDGGRAEVAVTDNGPGLGAEALARHVAALPPPEQPGGRGLYLVAHLAEVLRVDRVASRTVLRALFRTEPAARRDEPDREGTAGGGSGEALPVAG